MANPTNRTSRTRKRLRRANMRMTAPNTGTMSAMPRAENAAHRLW